jgi:cellulose synthase/poly-beta-1,6-N-acetylglucosamine synthase-like glycosyltransferase
MHNIALQFLDYCNTVILIYFVVTNLVYTVLMLLSLYAVSLHAKFARQKGYADISDSPVTPPVALIIPAYNEQDAIVQTVLSVLELNYPRRLIVVDDGPPTAPSAQPEVNQLTRMDLIYRPRCPPSCHRHFNPDRRSFIVISKPNGASRTLNVGINMARSSSFLHRDADSSSSATPLLRLIAPIVHSSTRTVVSGVVRIINGCTLRDGRIAEIDLPSPAVERQVVEYIRALPLRRPG